MELVDAGTRRVQRVLLAGRIRVCVRSWIGLVPALHVLHGVEAVDHAVHAAADLVRKLLRIRVVDVVDRIVRHLLRGVEGELLDIAETLFLGKDVVLFDPHLDLIVRYLLRFAVGVGRRDRRLVVRLETRRDLAEGSARERFVLVQPVELIEKLRLARYGGVREQRGLYGVCKALHLLAPVAPARPALEPLPESGLLDGPGGVREIVALACVELCKCCGCDAHGFASFLPCLHAKGRLVTTVF